MDATSFFCMKEFQLIKATGMIGLESPHFANLNEITDSGKYH